MSSPDRVRTHHDEWVKRALALWLGGLGEITLDVRIAGQSRRGDVLYVERRDHPARRRELGTLGTLARGTMLFEPSHNPCSEFDLKSYVAKLVELEAHARREARRSRRRPAEIRFPALCAITPSMSRPYAKAMGLRPLTSRRRGLYALLGASWRSIVVAVNELPKGRSTMWLRLLGRGKVQAQAVRELLQMSEQEPLRDGTMALLAAWHQALPAPARQSEADRELKMNLDQVYERWERKTVAKAEAKGEAKGKAEGKAEGVAKGKAEGVVAVLEGRGLAVSGAQRRHVLACTDVAQLDAWLRAAGTTPSAKALLATTPTQARAKR